MAKINLRDKSGLKVKPLKIVNTILEENPDIKSLFESSATPLEAQLKLREWLIDYLHKNPFTKNYYVQKTKGLPALKKINYRDYAAIRLLDYLDNEGRSYSDPNLKNKKVTSNPIKNLWLAINKGKGSANEDFFLDMLYLFRQINGTLKRELPDQLQLKKWMSKHPTGLDPEMIKLRGINKKRIIKKIIKKINSGKLRSERFQFEEGMTENEKFRTVSKWWEDYRFHLVFAIRSPELLNELLDHSLRDEDIKTIKKAKKKGIPIFINPYYLSLVDVDTKPGLTGADRPIRDYIFPSKELINEFGQIHAWEKEDLVQAGEPNAAGWKLPPYNNVHRRYPEVAIFIPDTAGRACGGLCVSCQRMYDFQSGRFNFDLNKLAPKMTWPEKMKVLLEYWEKDTQLRDILITGGDAFMNSDKHLKQILEEVYLMAERKKNANLYRPPGEKYAEILRVRLGTRLPVYLPQRITPNLIEILAGFKERASHLGINQFVVQTHIQTAMEITPEVKQSIEGLLSAGWMVTNQLVFTAASSRRGHTAKLRSLLNDLGVISYYTFSVKGFMENYHNFATNERAAQERVEEKYHGHIANSSMDYIRDISTQPEKLALNLKAIKEEKNIPFIATDRTVLNMPGVGKSLSYRTIGITDDGRRILEFDLDLTRTHSPIINTMENVIIIESKSIRAYLRQMDEIGEEIDEYNTIWGYSASETENRPSLFQYPDYDFQTTDELTNFSLEFHQTLDEENI